MLTNDWVLTTPRPNGPEGSNDWHKNGQFPEIFPKNPTLGQEILKNFMTSEHLMLWSRKISLRSIFMFDQLKLRIQFLKFGSKNFF